MVSRYERELQLKDAAPEFIGAPTWSKVDMAAHLEEFAALYGHRPIAENAFGMKAPHLFYLWFALRQLQPEAVIESGILKGQSTWLIEQACPNADLHCIDIKELSHNK